MEKLVALGAALDYTIEEPDANGTTQIYVPMIVKKPPESTALLLTVIGAMCVRQHMIDGGEVRERRELYEGGVECAIQRFN